VRSHPWGSYGHITATLELPTLQSYPICTPIPYRLRVTTRTKPVDHNEKLIDRGTPLFPAPPKNPAGLDFRLDCIAQVKAGRHDCSVETTSLWSLGGLGTAARRAAREAVSMVIEEPLWNAAKGKSGSKGTWTRSVTFSSSFVLTCPPTVDTSTLSCNVRSY
jgi:hypothetical protein